MKNLRFVLLLAILIFTNQDAFAVYAKTYFKGEADSTNTCCIELTHIYFTNDHQYIGVGTSYASLDTDLCCENYAGDVLVDMKTISQFQKDSLEKVLVYNESESFKKSVNNVLLRYKLGAEGKIEGMKVTQNPVSGKLILEFAASKSGSMNLEIEPINNNNFFTDEVKVVAGQNHIEINYVPYNQERGPISYLIYLFNKEEGFYKYYQHFFN